MSRPHLVEAGQVIFVTRQTLHRRFALRPDRQTRWVFEYLFAYYAKKYGILVHALCIMSTHYHAAITDQFGNRGAFFRDFHAMLTKVLLAYRGFGRSYLFNKSQTSQLPCVTKKAVIEAVGYILANPTNAGITADPREWPGNLIHVDELAAGKTRVVRRPDLLRHERGHVIRFFDPEVWPESVELTFARVPMLEEHGTDAATYQRDVQADLDARIRDKLAEGRRFTGVQRALRAPVHRTSALPLPFGELDPRVKAGTGETEARVAAIRRLKQFWLDHAEAVARVKAGLAAVFPVGTYRWVQTFGFPVAT